MWCAYLNEEKHTNQNLSYSSFKEAVPHLVKVYKSAKSESTSVDKIRIACELTDTEEVINITIRETFAGLTEDLQKNGKVKTEEGKSIYRITLRGDYEDSLRNYSVLFVMALVKEKLIQQSNVSLEFKNHGNQNKKPRTSEMKTEAS